MDIKKIHKLRNIYQEDLMERVLPFWLKYGVDKEYNGIITCLDYDGSCYCTDKSGWFQGRGMWAFAKAYNDVEKRAEFLQASQSAYHFLNKHCFDCDGRIFFEITRDDVLFANAGIGLPKLLQLLDWRSILWPVEIKMPLFKPENCLTKL